MTRRTLVAVTLTILLTATSGCGDGTKAAATAEAESDEASPCTLLTKEEASSVVPNHDGGYVAHAGGSLIKGVDSYQCSYSDTSGTLLTVIWHDAVDDARFEDIKPSFSLSNDVQKVDVAESGWMRVGEKRVEVTAVQKRTTIEVELMSPTAPSNAEKVLTLTKTVAAKLAARS
jgi:hypothetical protein